MKRLLLGKGLAWALFGFAAGGAAAEPIPLSAWIHDPVIDSVQVAPDGQRLAALTLTDINAPPEVTVWQTANLSAQPLRFKPKDSKALFMDWLNDNTLLVVGRQKFDYRIGGRPTKWFRNRIYLYTLPSADAEQAEPRSRILFDSREIISASLKSRLPNKKDKVLLGLVSLQFAEDLYELDLNTYNSKRVYRGAEAETAFVDMNGEVRSKQKFDGSGDTARLRFSYKHPQTGKWEEHHALYAAQREGMSPLAFGMDGRRVYMADNTGRDMSVIRIYDLITREIGDPIYGGGDIDALDVIQASNPEDFGKVVGFLGRSARVIREYREPKRQSMQKRLAEALPADLDHQWVSMSDDLTVIVVLSVGPREPGAYHLLVNGEQLVPLGRRFPQLAQEKLADMRFVTYEARDGLSIPGFLTVPSEGEPPFPAVVVPHGGPWARDYLGWDLWAQFLANRGYAVLQPQYRGSEGFGQALWRAGDREWGQKMQDDKDDGARWLAEQGIADPERIAIFGYSYGGYAAMAASVRSNSPYQCAISGAGLAELRTFDKVTYESSFGREYQNPTVAGLSPLDHAKEATIPIYIFHGDRDQRVPIEQSRKFANALRRAGKSVKYEEIIDLWHSFPWWPQHHLAILSSVEDYLANDCGPGGL